MKGQKVKPNQDGGIGNAKKHTNNQSEKQLLDDLPSVIAVKDQSIAEKDVEIRQLNISATKGQGVKRKQDVGII